jgi:predicted nucleic acid-binding protein
VTPGAFADTNIAVYALDGSEPVKQSTAQALLLATPAPATSPQVLRELYSVAVSKLSTSPAAAALAVETLLPSVAVVEDAALVLAAVGAAQRWQLSIWDALIVEAARRAGCSRLLSEDLQDGMDFDGVVVDNPFRQAG